MEVQSEIRYGITFSDVVRNRDSRYTEVVSHSQGCCRL